MPHDDVNIGFIGAGSMGGAMIAAIVKSGLMPADRVMATDLNMKRLSELRQAYGIVTVDRSDRLFNDSDIVVLATKPQQLDELLETLAAQMERPIRKRKLLISIAAGYPLHKIEAWLYAKIDRASRSMLPMIRVMPNTPALVSAGMAGICPNSEAKASDVARAQGILETMGHTLRFEEAELHAVTAISGSGPAYVFYLAESMITAGIELGLPEDKAIQLTLATLSGAAKLMALSGDSPRRLRRQVTSPGGTTEAAFAVLEEGGVRQKFVAAIKAAARRSEELGGQTESV